MKKTLAICITLMFIIILNSCKQERSNTGSEIFHEKKNEENSVLIEQNLKNNREAEPENIEGYSGVREEIEKASIDVSSENSSIDQQIIDTAIYRNGNKYWKEVVNWDEKNGRTGVDRPIEPLLYCEIQDYKKEELRKYPKVILYLAKNEIYAKNGYIFTNKDLQNYFLGQVWYVSKIDASEFNDNVFNEHELNNLKLLVDLLD